jgi:hypothetical protein
LDCWQNLPPEGVSTEKEEGVLGVIFQVSGPKKFLDMDFALLVASPLPTTTGRHTY